MRRVFWSAEYDEAHVVQAMLRSQRIESWVFDADMARQDWFRVLAIGGYRVMVTATDAPRAVEMIGEYRAGTLALADETVERPACPRCATPGDNDPAPHRRVFTLLITADLLFGGWLMLAPQGGDGATTFIVCFGSAVVVPLALIALTHALKGRYVCPQCTAHWRTRPASFAAMAREVAAAAKLGGAAQVDATP